jgi:polysaccharide deacetylase family protein (PEP-CTERM system associated)
MPAPFALTVDVEDYYHAQALAAVVPVAAWEAFRSRVVAPTERILELLAACGARATFFVLARVARRHPELIRRIVAAGHELASHGFDHQPVFAQTPEAFWADVRDSRSLLEDAGGVAVIGYRAPNFSIDARTPWAHTLLAKAGYRYSSSSHPVLNDRYGSLCGSRSPTVRDGVLEVPVVTLRLCGVNLPCGGGGYLRLLPMAWTRWALRWAKREGSHPAVFYIHPWELDPDQPRPVGLAWRTRLRHYRNLADTRARLSEIIARFGSERLDRLLGFAPSAAADLR